MLEIKSLALRFELVRQAVHIVRVLACICRAGQWQ